MLINAKLNDAAQKILWEEAVHACKRIRNSIATTGINTSPLENIYGENPKIIVFFHSSNVSDTSPIGKSSRSK